MRIQRSGARAHHGYSSIDLTDGAISWSADKEALVLQCRDVGDFSTDAHHDYEVTITVADFNRMVDAVAGRVTLGGAEDTVTELAASLRGMLRIVAAEVGLVQVRVATEPQEED